MNKPDTNYTSFESKINEKSKGVLKSTEETHNRAQNDISLISKKSRDRIKETLFGEEKLEDRLETTVKTIKKAVEKDNKETLEDVGNEISKLLKHGEFQQALNKMVIYIDKPENPDFKKMVDLAKKEWNNLSDRQQWILMQTNVAGAGVALIAFAPIMPVMCLIRFMVKTGILHYKRAPERESLKKEGKWAQKFVKWGTKIYGTYTGQLKELEAIIEPLLKVLDAGDEAMDKAYVALHNHRKQNVPANDNGRLDSKKAA